MLAFAPLSRLAPTLSVTSGTRLLRSTLTRACRCSISRRARSARGVEAIVTGSAAVAAANTLCASGGTVGRVSALPSASGTVTVPPQNADSARWATSSSARASRSSMAAPARATAALVCSTGDTLPACARRTAAASACAASASDACASRRRSWAMDRSKKARVTSARSSAASTAASWPAASRASSAARVRAARLPPSSSGMFSCAVMVARSRRTSSVRNAASGLRSRRAWSTAPSLALTA